MSTPATTAAPAAAAKPPAATPAATGTAVALALLLIAAGVVAVRDVLLSVGLITGSPWIAHALNYFDGLRAQTWMLPAGIAVAAVGVLMVCAALRPRRRNHLPLKATGTWITPKDVSRVACGACEAVTGVAAATASGSARRVTLTISPVAGYDTARLTAAVHTVATDTLAALARPPRLRIRIAKQKDLS